MKITVIKTGEVLDVRVTQTKLSRLGAYKVVGYVTAKGVFSPGEVSVIGASAVEPAPEPSAAGAALPGVGAADAAEAAPDEATEDAAPTAKPSRRKKS